MDAAAASLLSAILPEGLLDYFDIVNIEQGKNQFIISLEEYNLLSIQYYTQPYLSKGFLLSVLFEVFPIHGNKVLLKILRWR